MKRGISYLLKWLESEDAHQRRNDLLKLRIKNPGQFNIQIGLLDAEVEEKFKREKEIGINHSEQLQNMLHATGDTATADRINPHDVIQYLNDFSSYDELQYLVKQVYDKKKKIVFLIDKGSAFKGKVLNEIVPYKQTVKLVYLAEKSYQGAEIRKIYFFDDKEDARTWRMIDHIEGQFWTYQFESQHQQFILLSKHRLDLETCTVEGTLVPLEDNLPIGVDKKIKVGLPIIFVHTVSKSKPEFIDHQQLIDRLTKMGLTHEKFFNWLFSIGPKSYNHPDYFQYLISSYLLSSKLEYPLHLLVIARQGSGKSTMEDAIWNKYDEEQEIVEGSCSTMKSIIPSFKGNLPNPGAILRSNRLCIIDEFLRILMRAEKEDRELQLSSLNPILEHRNRAVGSGNSNLMMSPTSRILAVTNPVWGTGTMDGFTQHIDNSFISRLLVWYQDKPHIHFIESGVGLEATSYQMDQDEWLGILDYCHSFRAKYELSEVLKVYEKGFLLLGADTAENKLGLVRDVYTARYKHHIECLMDGIIKTRCICTQDATFTASAKDYKTLHLLWMRMIAGWGDILSEIDRSVLNDTIYKKTEDKKSQGEPENV